MAGGATDATLTLERAFDFLHNELGRQGMPMLPQIERELARRAFAAAEGDATAAAKSLGLTKVALQKRLKE
jgi:transcriptional regulator with PAS, ATPase and Fis domain